MAKTEEPQTQLATRIPKELHRRLKLYCVTHDIVLMHFVVAAIEEKLSRKQGSKKKTACHALGPRAAPTPSPTPRWSTMRRPTSGTPGREHPHVHDERPEANPPSREANGA